MNDVTKASTPWHVWAVGALATAWNGFGAFDFTASATRFAPYMSNFPQEMLDYLYAQPLWTWIAWACGVWGGLIGSVLLLMRNKFAVPAFGVSLLGAGVSMGASYFNAPPELGSNAIMTAIIIGIAVALFGYALWLSRRGLLR